MGVLFICCYFWHRLWGRHCTTNTYSSKIVWVRSLGLVLGVITVGYTIGASVGPLLTGYIFDVSGNYQIAFIINAIIGILGFILTMMLKPVSSD